MPNIQHTLLDHDAFVSQLMGPIRHTNKHDPVLKGPGLEWSPMVSPVILICGHNSRDTRCGILGPLLRTEFESYNRAQWQAGDSSERWMRVSDHEVFTKVALISHIGGHAFAGNVIVYLPKKMILRNGKVSPLSGLGIWYGRVEPRHVRGIVEETIQRGNIIEELLRGIHNGDMGGSGQEALR